jgi:hypothetical protein
MQQGVSFLCIFLHFPPIESAWAAIIFDNHVGSRKSCNFFKIDVNRLNLRRVVGLSQEFSTMNTTAILSAWPNDDRDRKRAPARS